MIVPQSRAFSAHPSGTVQILEVHAGIEILEQIATTTMDLILTNSTSRRLEAELAIPVPDGAVLRGFTFQGAALEPTARLLPRKEARRIYDSIVAQTRDPALLEFIGCNLIRSSVFPVEPLSGQRVRVIYEHLLPADNGRIDYALPRSESVEYQVPWKIAASIKSKSPIATVYSPSHSLETRRGSDSVVRVRLASEFTQEPGPFRLSYLLQQEGISASLLAYPDPKIGGGYFLLMMSPPVKTPSPDEQPSMKREIILVLDRSGSMQGEKIEQVREAALQVLEGLEEGEMFNIVVYDDSIQTFASQPVVKSEKSLEAARAYIKRLRAGGGTNIHDALVEALRHEPREGYLPLVLFLTDGRPTVGQTSEVAIRNVATQGNPHQRRIFTFGVGLDVNTPLLDRIASETRATPVFVLPGEDVEVKVGTIFKRLAGPVLASPTLQLLDPNGQPDLDRVRDLIPARLPDLFEGEQLILLGQYSGEKPLRFQLKGNYFGENRKFGFEFSLDKSSPQNGFIPRLWASRKIGVLTDAIRDLGADARYPARSPGLVNARAAAGHDPKINELVQAIVQLSKEYGILTEYTAFFAEEGTDLTQSAAVFNQASWHFAQQALHIRSGAGSVSQEVNKDFLRSQSVANFRNNMLDANLNRVAITTVQQVSNRAFYKRGDRWVDSHALDHAKQPSARVIQIGSQEFRELADRLAQEGSQASLALKGEILLEVDGERVLIQ